MNEIKHPLFEDGYYHGDAPTPTGSSGGEPIDLPPAEGVFAPLSEDEEARVAEADAAAAEEADASVAEDEAASGEEKDDETQPARRGRTK